MDLAFDVPVLSGILVRLEPLSVDHVPDLAEAAEEDRSTYDFTWVPRAAEVGDYVAAQLGRASSGRMIPFARYVLGTTRPLAARPTGTFDTWMAKRRRSPSRSAGPGWDTRPSDPGSIGRRSSCCSATP